MLGEESQVDILIEFLAKSKRKENITEVHVSPEEKPKRTTIYLIDDSTNAPSLKEAPFDAETLYLAEGEIKFRSSLDQARGRRIEAWVMLNKSVEGETLVIVRAAVNKTLRISGGYEFIGLLSSVRKHIRNAHRIFSECVARQDPKSWNQWYAGMHHGVSLKNLNLRGANLSSFDLCCADLIDCDLRNANFSGANLSGANLDSCALDGCVVEGADLFGIAIPAKYESLLHASGLLERESAILLSSN